MVWFQCEDCGENLKKPKLPSHFRICSANKLSCIDCGEMFTQQSVQGHTQCITEAEKYGPKGQGKVSNATPAKPKPDSKKNSDIDINVGLSSRPPWFCSLCNTNTTSKQTLLLHAEGKKHRAKARAFHASKKQLLSQTEESTPNGVGHTNGISSGKNSEEGSLKTVDELNESDPSKTTVVSSPVTEKQNHLKKKRKLNESESVVSNGEVIQAERSESESKSLLKEQKISNATVGDDQAEQKVKWKKLISSILKSSPDGVLKIKKLQKLVFKSLQETGFTPDEDQLQGTLMHKIESSSRFMLDKKLVRLAPKGGS